VIELEEARRLVLSALRPLAPCEVPLARALDHVAAADVVAVEPVPRFANSSMDGFALRAEDCATVPVTLRVTGTIFAGATPTSEVGPGEAMRIMTGAPLPRGANAIEIVEEALASASGDGVEVRRSIAPGTFVRHPGDDVEVGDVLVASGEVIDASRLAVLAGQGLASVSVFPRPIVGVLSTGDEVVAGTGTLPDSKIRDLNGPLLLALLAASGVDAVDLGVVRDDADEVTAALRAGVEACDAVVSTGGVSVGDADFVKHAVLALADAEARSLKVAVRPGKPFAFGLVGERKVPVFALAGNPVSTKVSFEMFVRPSLEALSHGSVAPRLTIAAELGIAMPRTPDGRAHVVHVTAATAPDGRVHVLAAARQGSHLLAAVSGANALVVVPDGEGLAAGAVVPLLVLAPTTLVPPTRAF